MPPISRGGGEYSGAVVGNVAQSSFARVYATGSVRDNGGVTVRGGLIGAFDDGSVNDVSAKVAVTSASAGGIFGAYYRAAYRLVSVGALNAAQPQGIGRNSGGSLSNAYFDNTIASGPNGSGQSTALMRQQTTFGDFDFSNVWGIRENVGYPYFARVRVRYGRERCPERQSGLTAE